MNRIQTGLPFDNRPFAVLAEKLGTDEATVIERLQWLKEHGYIRRVGPFFDSAKLGYTGTLVAVKVAAEKMKAVAESINRYPGVTHNYEREGRFNLWFALLSPNQAAQDKILQEVRCLNGVEQLISLPATKKFKVSVQFTL
ncbi:siroheme decarboxylase subunit alpha [Lucifera butyrica]|uniref:siroheme decarboxylase subunit alpha n=1 Tax=Lucifera butyrica TaxID=1351585 RepID=UPI001A9E386A|nr:Lrp/AsnC family transcriptional regulator [Lucifera butyrica]